jgi:glycosyltransferase involved in cell wall biosynthesis
MVLLLPVVRRVDRYISNKNIQKIESGKGYAEKGNFYSYCQRPYLESVASEFKVSVIVPNYNHARYLRQRLESIYNQTYKNVEVILLDDCSTDNSQEILEEFISCNPENTRLIINDKNSGGVFNQWEKGISLASGQLIWIAESDDYCSENFLESLVKYFSDEAVMLAYSRTVFVKGEANEHIWTIEEYLSDLDPEKWKSAFVRSSHELVRDAWSIKNLVPNVSSAVFRNPREMELLSDAKWKTMRICGDWMFYLSMIRGGMVAYTVDATNYYRIHEQNTSVSTYSKDVYYQEHERVAKFIKNNYKVDGSVFEKQKANLQTHWKGNRKHYTHDEFESCYSITRISLETRKRKPNLLMVGYSFAAGGGETFPIQLANLFKARGYGVTYMSCEQDEREMGVRNMLRPDIPVVTNLEYLNGLVERLGIDLIHSHHSWVDNTILDLLPENSACETVISLHGMYEMLADEDKDRILKRVTNRSSKIVYTAEKNVTPFKEFGYFNDHKFVKIDNALDIVDINPINRNDLHISPDAFVVCLVSRALPEKGWREAIEIIRIARELSGKDIQLILIGEGPEYDALKFNANDYIHFLGFIKNIRDYYAASDLGFLPSRFEGESFPLTIIDCLQAGTPVLASNKGEIPNMLRLNDVVAGSVFSLVNNMIPENDVARIIVKYATDDEFYSKHKDAVRMVARKFDPNIMADKYESAYAS